MITGVTLPGTPDPVPDEVLARLHPAEAAEALTRKGFTRSQYVGGRLALQAARRQIAAPAGPILSDDRGAPRLAAGWTVSVSHKRTLAVGIVARAHDGHVGIDLEDRRPERPRIAERVLRPAEREAVAALPPELTWQAVLLRFSIKESIYKALDPHVRRYVGFLEAEVDPDLDGTASVSLHLAHGEGPFRVDARYTWLSTRLLTTVRILPVEDTPHDRSPSTPTMG